MNDNTNRQLEERLARLDRRAGAQRSPRTSRRRTHRARRTKIVTAGASATAIVGLMALYGTSNVDGSASASGDDALTVDAAPPNDLVPNDLVPNDLVPNDLVVVIDAAGNVVSAPDELSADVVDAAVSAAVADGSVTTSTLAPVSDPNEVDLAVPAVDTASSADDADEGTAVTQAPVTDAPTTTAAPTTTTAPAATQTRRAPHAQSTGS